MELDRITKDLREALAANNGRFAEIARMSGLSDGWVSMFAAGHIANPGVITLHKLQKALKDLPQQ